MGRHPLRLRGDLVPDVALICPRSATFAQRAGDLLHPPGSPPGELGSVRRGELRGPVVPPPGLDTGNGGDHDGLRADHQAQVKTPILLCPNQLLAVEQKTGWSSWFSARSSGTLPDSEISVILHLPSAMA
jgi:hypothetical protein